MQLATVALTFTLGVLILVMPRRLFYVPIVIAACFIPADQRLIILDLDFTPLRILIALGIVRSLVRREAFAVQWTRADKLVFTWTMLGAIIYVLQLRDTKAVIYKCGVVYDVLGLYWLSRQHLRNWDDIVLAFRTFAYCCIVLLPFILYERFTRINVFTYLGYVHTVMREGKARCAGPYPHSIILGIFWATLCPIFWNVRNFAHPRALFVIGVGSCIAIVIATQSATPVGALLVCLIVLFLFRWRWYTRVAAWGLLVCGVALHLIMTAPVWHLLARIQFVDGSTGYHRYKLIDAAIRYFSEWALLGTRSTAHWGWGLEDITNQYVLEAVRGGIWTLAMFVFMLWWLLKSLLTISFSAHSKELRYLVWALFASLTGHCVAFIGVSYFGQINMLFCFILATIAFVYDLEVTQKTVRL